MALTGTASTCQNVGGELDLLAIDGYEGIWCPWELAEAIAAATWDSPARWRQSVSKPFEEIEQAYSHASDYDRPSGIVGARPDQLSGTPLESLSTAAPTRARC